MHCTRVLALLVLHVGLVHSFSWDIVVGGGAQLEFYYNGTLTHTKVIPSYKWITSVTYDPVHYRVLFADQVELTTSISSFDLLTRKTQLLVTTEKYDTVRVVYDLVTQALYWKAGSRIYSFSLNPASSNQADGNLVVELNNFCFDLAVDSCGGYIYWVTDNEIERAWLDGSEREVLINSTVSWRQSLAIDQQTQKIYWTEQAFDEQWSIESANFNGKNRTTLLKKNPFQPLSLAVSKDFIYWQIYKKQGIWQLPKYSSQTVARKLHSSSSTGYENVHLIATNYTIKEQIQGINSCDGIRGLIPNDLESESTVSVCQNYCFKGECSVSVQGQPTCSCEAGYSGERCEVNACHDYCLHGSVCSLNEEGKPACQCTAGYNGERCNVFICNDYCFKGNCSVGAEGQPKCSCEAGYSGERCEVNACHDYCLHGSVCSLNEEGKPACQCTAGYNGERCNVFICNDYCFKGNCSVGAEGQPKCSCKAGYSGERCEVNACHKHCLNGGVCSLNEEDKPACQCAAGYDGERCDVSICMDYCVQGICSVGAEGQPKCSCKAEYSGERCEVNACQKHCLNGGVCSLNEEDNPACQCAAGYDGERCDVSICKDYCVQGTCSVGAEGQPKCSCMTGYSGERCEVNTCCHEYCLNSAVCSLNEENMPTYQDSADYDGGRCEVSANKDNSSDASNFGEGKISACHQFCLNDGNCSLNEANAPVCQCTVDYAGERCDVPAFVAKWVYNNVPPVTVSDAVKSAKSTRASTVV